MPVSNICPVSVKLEPDIRARVEHLAEIHRRSAHWIMREAIQQYVEREEKREALRQDLINAWNDYQATELHAPAKEVEEWVASWWGENELPVPECVK
jgi:predicted transcriptional regulator